MWAALSVRQRKQLCARGNFIVRGKDGRSYRITGIKSLCCAQHPPTFYLEIEELHVPRAWRRSYWHGRAGWTKLPIEEIALAAKLTIEADECGFRKLAQQCCGTVVWG